MTVKRKLTLGLLVAAMLLMLGVLTRIGRAEEAIGAPLHQADDEVRTVSVTGAGQVSAEPDTAVVTVGVETEAEEATEALDENGRRMQELIDALEDAGIEPEDLQTQAVRLRPQYEERRMEDEREPRREVVGYVATNTVEVTVQDIETLGELLDTAIEAGGNRIEGVRFELSNPTEVLDEAREAAWNDAQRKAEQLATLADEELGQVLSINESSRTPRPIVRGAAAFEEAEADVAVPIEPGRQTVDVTVQVTWQLQ